MQKKERERETETEGEREKEKESEREREKTRRDLIWSGSSLQSVSGVGPGSYELSQAICQFVQTGSPGSTVLLGDVSNASPFERLSEDSNAVDTSWEVQQGWIPYYLSHDICTVIS